MSRSLLFKTILLFLVGLVTAIPALADEGQSPLDLNSDAFPIGLYGVVSPSGKQLDEIKSWGVDYIHTYGMGVSLDKDRVQRDQDYLDKAHKHGLKVMVNLRARTWVMKLHDPQAMLKYVKQVEGHSALGFWYLFDEPDNHDVPPEEVQPFYAALKKETPNVPIAVAHAWSKHWYKYDDVLDIMLIDTYPVKHQPFPGAPIQHTTNFMASAMNKPDRVVMPVLQLFNWKSLAKPGKEKIRGGPVDEMRYPTKAELRYWCYATLAQGRGACFGIPMSIPMNWTTGNGCARHSLRSSKESGRSPT